MRVKLLIATTDTVYAKLISDSISKNHTDIIDVSVCGEINNFIEALTKKRYDIALMDAEFMEAADTQVINLPMLLWTGHEPASEKNGKCAIIPKYQRISSTVSAILRQYAEVSKNNRDMMLKCANITAVWSPSGGAGKTTVALAYAASRAAEEKEVLYLNLEDFSSIPGYFKETGTSISAVFEMLDSNEGDIKMLVQGIRRRDNGIMYLCSPDNFDDICILTSENVKSLVTSCAQTADELVIDLSCACDSRTRKVFELADTVLIVTEATTTAEAKLTQFSSQHNVLESILEKTMIVANKGAAAALPLIDAVIRLPFVQSDDETAVYKALSQNIASQLANMR